MPSYALAPVSLLAALLGSCSSPAPSIVTSPRHWPAADLANYAQLNTTYGAKRPLAEAPHAMIVGTSGPLAIHAGAEVLRQGGCAMDAALTTSLAQITLTGGSWNSLAGIMYLLYFDARTGKVHALNAGWDVPRAETDPLSIPKAPTPSGRSALVPGFMAGVAAAHERYGKVPFARLFDPAIYLAEEGFIVDRFFALMLAGRKEVLSRRPETKAIFTRSDGAIYTEGELFRQPRLAETLRRVAAEGATYMYEGPWAARAAAAVQEDGGALTVEDLRRYRPTWGVPISIAYRDYQVFTVPAPEVGGVQLIEALNLIEASDLVSLGHYTKSAEALSRFIDICRVGYAYTYSAGYDPMAAPRTEVTTTRGVAVYPPRTAEDRMADAAAQRNWEMIRRPGWEAGLFALLQAPAAHSDAVVAVDAEGNAVALVHSSNTTIWGATGINVDGISIPDSACFQQDMLRRAGAGNRLPNITNPAIVLKDGRLALASSCIGSSLHEGSLQNLVNVLDFGMNPKEAVETPAFGSPVFVGEGGASEYIKQAVVKGEFPETILEGLKKLGREVREYPNKFSGTGVVQYWIAVQTDPGGKGLRGAAAPGLNGIAEGN